MNSSEHIWGDQEVYNEEYVFCAGGKAIEGACYVSEKYFETNSAVSFRNFYQNTPIAC